VKIWCQELQMLPADRIHRPDLLAPAERQTYKLNGYPKPVVRIEKWAK